MSYIPRLVCAVSYMLTSGERMQFRKFFKFQVQLWPLLVLSSSYCCCDCLPVGDDMFGVLCDLVAFIICFPLL